MTRHACGALAIAMLWGAGVAFGQALPSIRRSNELTPQATDRTVIRQQRIDVATLTSLGGTAQSQVLELDLFPDVLFRARRLEWTPTVAGGTWTGVLEGYPDSTVVFALARGEVVGHISAPFGFFTIARLADGSYLAQQVDQGMFPEVPDAVIPPDDPDGSPSPVTPDGRFRKAVDDGTIVDLLVAFTADAETGLGGDARARATIDLIVTETNLALQNSGLRWRVRLVHAARVSYAETGNSSTDLVRAATVGDGFLDDLHALRDAYAADVVTLITERMDDACGIGYLSNPRSTPRFAFSLVARRCTTNGRTFAHELGHNFGGSHDWYQTASPGAYSYSKGFVSVEGRYLDIMAYSDHCRALNIPCTQPLLYANPALHHGGYAAGVPVGTGVACTAGNTGNPPCDADLARTFVEMGPVVSRFRDSQTSVIKRQILPNESVRSADGRYRLTYQLDGNLVLIDDRDGRALWASGTTGTSPGQVAMQGDGNLVIYDSRGLPVWSSGTAGNTDAYFVVQNDGNFVIYRADGRPLWGSQS